MEPLAESAAYPAWMVGPDVVPSAPAVTVHPGEAEGTVVVVEGTLRPARYRLGR